MILQEEADEVGGAVTLNAQEGKRAQDHHMSTVFSLLVYI